MTEWLSRTEMMIGNEALNKLKNARVLIVGVGGVGAFAAEMICRAGIGNMTIVDGDTVHESNRNRQMPALKSTEGVPKVYVTGSRLLDINPGLKLTSVFEYVKDESITRLFETDFDFVVDAIDTLSPKIFLIRQALQKNIPIVSSMGAGGRYDPLKITICDISETINCGLARILRKRLHRLGIREGVTAVYSPEVVEKEKVNRIRSERNKASIVGTVSYMPAAFGIACASVVIRDLAGIAR
jgi:tRNA A37 threonylcarbamoyladenosine dehydratase